MIKRELYLKKLEMYAGRDEVKIILGMRRCGKTTIIKQFIEELKAEGVPQENIVYINFEGLIYSYFNDSASLRRMLIEFLQSANGRVYFFFDEMQGVDRWAEVLCEMMNFHDCEFYVSSSNDSILYDGYAKDLGYRYVRIDVYPLVFSEFLMFKELDENPDYEALLKEFIKTGGFPGVYEIVNEEDARINYLKDTLSAAVLRDVVQCRKLRDVSHIDKIMDYLLSHIGETFSPKALKDYVKQQGITISVDTVYSFLDALIGAGIVHRVKRLDIKEERELETQEKYYFADIAMRNAAMGDEGISLEAMLENVLYIELLTRGFKVNVGKYGTNQVDFIATRGEDRTYLNCCNMLTEKEDIRREFSTLTKIRDNYFKMVLSMDEETKVNKGGIINYPIFRFLVNG
ncbi:MAG: ATP-binding protein [Eubacteriales bacterium]|nr:ATP-binding protein [Eubacteriales bacterium]